MKHDPLLDELRVAFPPVPIVASGAFAQRGILYSDASEYERRMDGKTWDELDVQFFARRADGLSFLGTPFIVSVLPFYLHLLLALEPTSPVAETLLPQLTKPLPTDSPGRLFGELTRRFDELARSLTPSQARAVASTLRAFVAAAPGEAHRVQPALDRYWYAFA